MPSNNNNNNNNNNNYNNKNKKKGGGNRNGNKKKGNARNRTSSIAASTCAYCARHLSKASSSSAPVECICTAVLFCTSTNQCRHHAITTAKHVCPGPPPPQDSIMDVQEKLRQLTSKYNKKSSLDSPVTDELFRQEHRTTVLEPMIAFLVQHALSSSIQNMTAQEYANYADDGHIAAAYMAGVHYKNRLLGALEVTPKNKTLKVDNHKHNNNNNNNYIF